MTSLDEFQWSDRPSQLLNAIRFTFSLGLLYICLFVLPKVVSILLPDMDTASLYIGKSLALTIICKVIYDYVFIRLNLYKINSGIFTEKTGVFSRSTETIDLFRVKDIALEEPFFLRIFKMGNIILYSSDKTSPTLKIRAISRPEGIFVKIRESVKHERKRNGVREFD